MPFSTQEFYAVSGYCNNDIPTEAVEFYLASFSEMVEKALGYRLTTAPVVELDKINYPSNNHVIAQNFFSIGAWQEAGLTIKIGKIDETDSNIVSGSPLVLGTDYDVFRFATGYQKLPPSIVRSNPVVGIRLLHRALPEDYMLRIWGTWGFGTDIPQDIKMFIYSSLTIALEVNQAGTNSLQSGGSGLASGAVAGIQEYTTKIEFNKSSSNLLGFLLTYFTDMMSTDAARSILLPYKIQFKQQIYQF